MTDKTEMIVSPTVLTMTDDTTQHNSIKFITTDISVLEDMQQYCGFLFWENSAQTKKAILLSASQYTVEQRHLRLGAVLVQPRQAREVLRGNSLRVHFADVSVGVGGVSHDDHLHTVQPTYSYCYWPITDRCWCSQRQNTLFSTFTVCHELRKKSEIICALSTWTTAQ